MVGRMDKGVDSAVTVDGDNNILVTDRKNHRLRMIAADHVTVTTLAGAQEGNADGEVTLGS
jgi:hypothetical protein